MSAFGPMDQPVALQRRVLRDGVHDRLLEKLLDGSLAPESALSIDGLARQLAVSPTPVREALAQLEHTGLVMRMPLRGYRVAPRLTHEQVRSLVDARSVIEHAALDRAFEYLDELIPALTEALERQAVIVDRMVAHDAGEGEGPAVTAREYFDADWGFHQVIRACAHNEYLDLMGESVSGHSYRVRQSYGRGLTDITEAVAEHRAILDAVAAGNLKRAHEEMTRHLSCIAEHSESDKFA